MEQKNTRRELHQAQKKNGKKHEKKHISVIYITLIFFLLNASFLTYQHMYVKNSLDKIITSNKTTLSRVTTTHEETLTQLNIDKQSKLPKTDSLDSENLLEEAALEETSEKKERDAIISHTVLLGETLGSIANSYTVTVNDLSDWNDLSDNLIFEGQTLKIHGNNHE